ncbi:hypothetical protein ACWEKT_18195 [Nocardia takedensis]
MTNPGERPEGYPGDPVDGRGDGGLAGADDPASTPDVGFTLGGPSSRDTAGPASPVEEAATAPESPDAESPVDIQDVVRELGRSLARELATAAPAGWVRLSAVFAVTVVAGGGQVLLVDENEQLLRLDAPQSALDLVARLRDVSAEFGDGPWWRLLLELRVDGRLEIDYDYGDEPFPDDQLFPPEAYLADLRAYPRDRVPLWLAAYVGHDERQSRPASEAAVRARADRAAGVRAVRSDQDFPDLVTLWARWAVMSAAFVAAGSEWGPRLLPSLGWFEGARRSGSTLYLLPGDRAVLSGGVWNAPELEAAYHDERPMPALYTGAPAWVANPVLNPRAGSGLLSFCYWWEGGRWYRGESPAGHEISDAVPGIWSARTVEQVIGSLVENDAGRSAAVAELVAAAEAGLVGRDHLAAVFGNRLSTSADSGADAAPSGDTDAEEAIDAALYQLTLAGVAAPDPIPIPDRDAVELVRAHLRESEADGAGYPSESLRADRIPFGWVVYAPTGPEELAVGRALFYVADDGVLERSSSSIAPSVYARGFEERYLARAGSGAR